MGLDETNVGTHCKQE